MRTTDAAVPRLACFTTVPLELLGAADAGFVPADEFWTEWTQGTRGSIPAR